MAVALRSLAGIIVLAAFTIAAYSYRISVEERAMLTELGEEYSRYMKRTKRLIPFII